MRKNPLRSFIFSVMLACATGCTHEDQGTVVSPLPDSLEVGPATTFCGKAELVNVESKRGNSLGVFELQNDASFLWVTFTPTSGLYMLSMSLFVGDPQDCPRQINGATEPQQFPIQIQDLHQQFPWSARIPLNQLSRCLFAAARIRVGIESNVMEGELESGRKDSIIPGLMYCIQECNATLTDCDLGDQAHSPRTIPQSEWTNASDHELGQQLREGFPDIYPKGLVLGCNYQISFMTPEDVLMHLPMSGKPEPLKATGIASKTTPINNRLLGELLTLELAMKLDVYFPEFSHGKVPLGTLQVTKGAFEGWTLGELQDEGNSILGGCTSNYNPEQIDEVLQGINANFAKGAAAGDYLRCPTK